MAKEARIKISDDIEQEYEELVNAGYKPSAILKAGIYYLKNKDKLSQPQANISSDIINTLLTELDKKLSTISIPQDIINTINQLSNKLTELENKLNELSSKLSNIKAPDNLNEMVNKLETLYNKLSNIKLPDNTQILNKLTELENKIKSLSDSIKNIQKPNIDLEPIRSQITRLSEKIYDIQSNLSDLSSKISQLSQQTNLSSTSSTSSSSSTYNTSQQSSQQQQKRQKTSSDIAKVDIRKIYQEAYAMALKKLEEEKQQKAKK